MATPSWARRHSVWIRRFAHARTTRTPTAVSAAAARNGHQSEANSDHSNVGARGRSGRAGNTPRVYTQAYIASDATKSNAPTTTRLEVMAGTFAPWMRAFVSAIVATSPTLAGMTTLMASPAVMAPNTSRSRTVERGKAAASTRCHAKARNSRLATWSGIAASRNETSMLSAWPRNADTADTNPPSDRSTSHPRRIARGDHAELRST